MDWLTAFVEVTKASAWPTAVLLLAWMFKRPLEGLIQTVESVRFKDAELKIAKRIEEAKELQQKAVASADGAQMPSVGSENFAKIEAEILDVLSSSPQAAILLSWRTLETSGRGVVDRLKIPNLPPHLRSGLAFAEVLRNQGKISTEQMQILSKLRKIRNDVTHVDDRKITEESALDYVTLALALAKQIDSLGR